MTKFGFFVFNFVFFWVGGGNDTTVVCHFLLQLTLQMRKLRQAGLSNLPRVTQLVSEVRFELRKMSLPDSKPCALSTAPPSCPGILDRVPDQEPGGPEFKFGLRCLSAMPSWASHLTLLASVSSSVK